LITQIACLAHLPDFTHLAKIFTSHTFFRTRICWHERLPSPSESIDFRINAPKMGVEACAERIALAIFLRYFNSLRYHLKLTFLSPPSHLASIEQRSEAAHCATHESGSESASPQPPSQAQAPEAG